MTTVRTPAILLRGHDYGDTSRILRFYTEGHGVLSVVGHGVRGKSGKGATTLSTFSTGEMIAHVKPNRDLHTLKDFSCTRLREGLGADVLRFAGASAAAELVLAHAEQERHPDLFRALESVLDSLDNASRPAMPATILAGLWTIIEAFGFAPQLDPCVRCATSLDEDEVGRFDFAAGGVRCEACGRDAAGPRIGPRARAQVGALLRGEAPEDLTHVHQHLGLVTDFIAYHVASRPLKSLRFLGSVLPAEAASSSVG